MDEGRIGRAGVGFGLDPRVHGGRGVCEIHLPRAAASRVPVRRKIRAHGARAVKRRGQGLVEAALVMLVFLALLIGVLDCGQVLYSHQALVARVEEAARWGSVHPFDGTGDQIANLILYSQPEEPRTAAAPFLGLTRANIVVRYQAATPDRPDDETISVAIVNYQSHFFSPWIARTIVNARPVLVTAPVAKIAPRW